MSFGRVSGYARFNEEAFLIIRCHRSCSQRHVGFIRWRRATYLMILVPLQVRVSLGLMVMKGWLHIPQIFRTVVSPPDAVSVIPRTPKSGGGLSFCSGYSWYSLIPVNRVKTISRLESNFLCRYVIVVFVYIYVNHGDVYQIKLKRMINIDIIMMLMIFILVI